VEAVRRCKEEANASDGLLMDDISEGEPPEGFVREAVVEALDEIICDESFLNLQDSNVESEISGVDRSVLQESWEVDIVEDEKNLALQHCTTMSTWWSFIPVVAYIYINMPKSKLLLNLM